MATVFAARQVGPKGVGRLVAVKVMSTALASDPASQEAFLREAAISTRIEHPNVVRTYEIGEVDGEIFIAMELVHGESLSNLQKGAGPVPFAVAVRIVSDVARGLHAAHEVTDIGGRTLGLVHQDVTPHNIVVGYDGISKLLDFGVARFAVSDGSRTDTIRGKPAYLAPEQLLLERIDRRTDLFALGIVLHELLTGQRLFPQDGSMARAVLTRGEVVPDVRAARPDVPAPIAEVVAKALQTAPDDRFASVDEMRRAMNAARVACGIAEAEEADVGAWARARVTPPWTLVELERELSEVGAFVTEHERVADLPTLKTLDDASPSSPSPRSAPRPSASLTPAAHPRWGWIALGGMALLLSAVLGFGARGLREPTRVASPEPLSSASSSAAGEAGGAPAPLSAPLESALPSPTLRGTTSSANAQRGSTKPARLGSATAAGANASAAAGGTAYVTVWSNPWGRVRIDGRDIGDSPISRMAVKSGAHAVSVTTKAGEQQERRITLGSGEEKTERFVF